jgi:hypothetical protein
VSPLELVGDGFDGLAAELRAARPEASDSLRRRVAELRVPEPRAPRWRFRPPSRRIVLGLAGAALLASFVAAGLTGLGSSGKTNATGGARVLGAPRVPGAHTSKTTVTPPGVATYGRALEASPDALAPTSGRLQRYDATLQLRVKDVDGLSRATERAINLTRGLGGFVGSVQYATHSGKRGGATLVLRVPVGKIQAELDGLTSLGTILQQHTGILDVTRRVDREAIQIAQLERELETATPAQAVLIRQKLATLRVKHRRLVRSARLARITLGLTTPAKQAAAPPSKLDRTLDDAGSVLVREFEILLYALVVAGPLLLLGAAVVAAAKAQRRRADARLLERT